MRNKPTYDRKGQAVNWDCAGANVYDATFHPLIRQFEPMIVLADSGFKCIAWSGDVKLSLVNFAL